MALDKETIKEFRLAIADKNMSDDEKQFFKDELDKEGISYTETEEEVVEKKTKATKKAKATRKKTKEKKEKKEFDLAKAKKDLKQKFGKTEEECEKIISEYKKAREKAKQGRKKRTSKLKKDGKLIKGTDVKDAGATLDTAKTKVTQKIKTEIKKVEDKADEKVKKEVKQEVKEQAKTKKPKSEQIKAVKKVEEKEKKKAEKEVEKETKKVAVKIVVDTSNLINDITKALSNFDKKSSKEYLKQLRKDIDKLLAKYDAGGFTQTLNITQSNLSSSSVNPSQFKKGGDIEFFGQKYKAMGGKIFDLTPSDRKSFYGKAKVMERDGKSYLQSYSTIVAEYNPKTKKIKIYDYYSPTTARHINAFLEYYGYPTMTKSEILAKKNKSFKKGGDVEFFGQKFKAKGGDIEFFGQKYKKKGGIVDKFSDAYNDLVKELGFKKKGGDIEFFGQKYKKKGGVVEKFNKAYKDLVKELGFKKGGDVKYFGQDYKKKGGDVEFFGQKYKKKGGGISYEDMFKKRNLYNRLEKIEFLDEELEQLESNYGQISSMADRDILEEIKKIHKELDKLKAPRKVYSKLVATDKRAKGGDVEFFGQKYKKKGGDIEFFGQKYKARGGGIRKYKQGYNDRDDESLGARRGSGKRQDYRARRDESKGELKHKMMRAYSDVGTMDRGQRFLKKGGKTDWIEKVVDSPNFRKGAFTKKAKARGLTPEEFMRKVLNHPSRYDERTRRQAQFMKNI